MQNGSTSTRLENTRNGGGSRNNRTARWWIATIPLSDWNPNEFELPEFISWIKGQGERGAGGFEHWQCFIQATTPIRRARLKRLAGFERGHFEPTRSEAAITYVCKEDTRINGTEVINKFNPQFELGSRKLRRNSEKDWDLIRERALAGDLRAADIPADIFIRYYGQLKYENFLSRCIAKDFGRAPAIERSTRVYWGPTGTGKSRRAWHEAGEHAYIKSPLSKWWESYQGQTNIIIDEFRGIIDIAHLLLWLDRYPCFVEVKGGSVPLLATNFWICSNLHPREWYREIDELTYKALERRLEIIHMDEQWEPIESEELIEVTEE